MNEIDNQASAQSETTNKITATRLSGSKRADALATHFPPTIGLVFEQACFAYMDRFVPAYSGGYWEFFELSNGGFFMTPALQKNTSLRIEIDSNGYSGEMGDEALGIVVSLFALSYLMHKEFSEKTTEGLVNQYYALRDFASEHPERAAIFRAID